MAATIQGLMFQKVKVTEAMKARRFLFLFAATAVAAAMTACGGSGDVSDPIPEGFWHGTMEEWDTSALSLIVLEDGETWGLYGDGGIGGLLHGWTTGQGDDEFSGTMQRIQFTDPAWDGRDGFDVDEGTYAGEFSDKDEISATGTFGTESVAFSGGYEAAYDQTPVSLKDLAGTFMGLGYAGIRDGQSVVEEEFEFVIDEDGTVEIKMREHMARHMVCPASGTIEPRPTGKNVFDLQITFKGTNCILGDETELKGIAVSDGEALITMARGFGDSERVAGFVFHTSEEGAGDVVDTMPQ